MIQLTPRLRQIALLVAENYSTKRICSVTGLSGKTVDEYIKRIAKKLPGEGSYRYKIMRVFATEALVAKIDGLVRGVLRANDGDVLEINGQRYRVRVDGEPRLERDAAA